MLRPAESLAGIEAGAQPFGTVPAVGRLARCRVGIALGLVALLAWGGQPLAASPRTEPATRGDAGVSTLYAGSSLAEALLALASQGLKIVFSSEVVRPDMVVTAEPVASRLLDIASELLAAHGLTTVDGPGGTVVVVRRAVDEDAAPALEGVVLTRETGLPLAGARVLLLAANREDETGEDGRFSFPDAGRDPVTLEVSAPGHIGQRLDRVEPTSLERLEVVLDRLPVITEQLVVSPSRLSLLRERPAAPLGLDRNDIAGLPHLGGDFYRALTLLPGTTANDVSVRFHARGGHDDETQILIDGQELYEAYHLQDYDSALSLIAPGTIASADLSTGGFQVRYGDRMSGVLDMTSVAPRERPTFRVALGLLAAQAGGSGRFAGERGSWLLEARRGSGVLVDQLLQDGTPEFWDTFAKSEFRLGSGHRLRLSLLASGDDLEFRETVAAEEKSFETEYSTSYLWLTHQAVPASDVAVDSALSLSRIDRDRRGFELEEDVEFAIRDRRDSDIVDLRQDWSALLGARHSLAWGGRWRRFETFYDYSGTREFDNPLASIRHDFGRGVTSLRSTFRDRQASAYLMDRFRLFGALTLELGARWDRHSLVRSSRLSPRVNLAWAAGQRTVLRAAWGRFTQSQRTYELQVEDGELDFAGVERASQHVLGVETMLAGRGESTATVLRFEVYEREVANPRPRFENLYEPLNVFPEVEPDRVLTAPDRSLARGLEAFARGRFSRRVGWWASYTYATTEDRIDGAWVPRPFDETHSLSLDLDFEVGFAWHLNLAWRYHSGWPTTPLALAIETDDEGEPGLVPVLGRRNSDRLSAYHRLDFRASRRWRRERFIVDLYVDIQNVYDRGNAGGFDIEIDDEEGVIVRSPEEWAGVLPSAGLSVEF